MQTTRKEDDSLYLYLRDQVISPYYSEISEGESITLSSTGIWNIGYSNDKHPFNRGDYDGRGRGLLYFDRDETECIFGVEQSDIVRVYDGSITASGYTVNYLTGQIMTTEDLAGYQVDYEWHYVSVLDAWPREDVPPLPIVSIELQEGGDAPLQLGYGDIRLGYWNIQIFAEHKGQRDDLMDIIHWGLKDKRCKIYSFDNGLPLSGTGTYNSSFTTDINSPYRWLVFESVKKRLSGLPRWGFYEQEDINKYRAEITFETSTFKS